MLRVGSRARLESIKHVKLGFYRVGLRKANQDGLQPEAADRSPQPLTRVSFGRLQVQADALAIDQNRSGIEELLARAVVALITA